MAEDRLKSIFNHQRELMGRFHAIEQSNGFRRAALPLCLDRHISQERLRGLAWHVIEEFGEAVEAPINEFHEEMVDTLHFLVELMITAGCEVHHMVSVVDTEHDSLSYLYMQAEKEWPAGFSPPTVEVCQLSFVISLARAMHVLKNKPWKQTSREVDIPVFFARLRIALVDFIALCRWSGLPAQELYDRYFQKNAINHQRIEQGV